MVDYGQAGMTITSHSTTIMLRSVNRHTEMYDIDSQLKQLQMIRDQKYRSGSGSGRPTFVTTATTKYHKNNSVVGGDRQQQLVTLNSMKVESVDHKNQSVGNVTQFYNKRGGIQTPVITKSRQSKLVIQMVIL